MTCRAYAMKRLTESGINFKGIPKKNILVTCKQYTGTISKENYSAVIKALNDIYKKL
jgi:hypothetical protein